MIFKVRMLLISCVVANMAYGTASTDPQVLQMELELLIKSCSSKEFISKYSAFEATCESIDKKKSACDYFQSIARKVKLKKHAALKNMLDRGFVQNYWAFAKLIPQVPSAGFLGFLGIICFLGYKGFVGPNDPSKSIKGNGSALFGSFIFLLPAVLLTYCAVGNYVTVFRQHIPIQKDIKALDEIIRFIETTQAQMHR